MNKNSLCVYDGLSVDKSAHIIVILSGIDHRSINDKTHDMTQAFILCHDVEPALASTLGLDVGICGNCTLRPFLAKLAARDKSILCYADKHRGPNPIWHSWHNGNIAYTTPREAGELIGTLRTCDCESNHKRSRCPNPLQPLGMRQGAYGDPATVPEWVWLELQQGIKGTITSYTHQWETSPVSARDSMASIDPQTWPDVHAAIDKANSLGFRTYRVLDDGESLRSDEIMCPEANGLTNCNRCGLCSGQLRSGAKNIAIPEIHGRG
jgi:hypothetical protein